MKWDNEYRQLYKEVIRKKLPKSFVAMYEKNEWLHDCFLKSFYIANTGPDTRVNSRKGSTTLQMEFFTSQDDVNVLLVYQNVVRLNLNHRETDEISRSSPTGFGSCMVNTFRICDDGTMEHEYLFESDSTITVQFERLHYEKVRNHFWK